MHVRTHDYLVTAVIEREVVNEIRGSHKGKVTGWRLPDTVSQPAYPTFGRLPYLINNDMALPPVHLF